MPRQRSRSPLSPILATESATVRLFFILSVLLCSVNKAGLKTETWLLYCLRLRSRSPHNAKHSTSIYIRVVRGALNVLRASFSPKFQYFSAVNVTPVSFFPIFQYFVNYVCHAAPCAMEFYSSPLDSLGLNSSAMDSCAMDSSALNSFAMDSSAIFYTTSQVLIVYCYYSYKQNPNECIVHVLCRCFCTCR